MAFVDGMLVTVMPTRQSMFGPLGGHVMVVEGVQCTAHGDWVRVDVDRNNWHPAHYFDAAPYQIGDPVWYLPTLKIVTVEECDGILGTVMVKDHLGVNHIVPQYHVQDVVSGLAIQNPSPTPSTTTSKCECGAYKTTGAIKGAVGHSSWCPWA